jgi:hypothetical protein
MRRAVPELARSLSAHEVFDFWIRLEGVAPNDFEEAAEV